MALEINEIGIRMRVEDEGARSGFGYGGEEDEGKGGFDPCGDLDRQRVVADCVRRVLAILERRQER